MATDECLGAQAQGRESVLIQNGDWCGILPQSTKNIAASANRNGCQNRNLPQAGREAMASLTRAAKW